MILRCSHIGPVVCNGWMIQLGCHLLVIQHLAFTVHYGYSLAVNHTVVHPLLRCIVGLFECTQ